MGHNNEIFWNVWKLGLILTQTDALLCLPLLLRLPPNAVKLRSSA